VLAKALFLVEDKGTSGEASPYPLQLPPPHARLRREKKRQNRR